MADPWFAGLSVAPISSGELTRFDAELDAHHWLGHRMVGETLRYVARDAEGEWVALVGFASPALSCAPRDRFIGWSTEVQFRRLRYVVSNQRFCVLPGGRRPNAASAVLSRTLKRLSDDWVQVWGHPVVLVETFVDPSRHVGTCYAAASFVRVGQTRGFGRRSGRYVEHGSVKDVYVRPLHPTSCVALAGAFDHPLLFCDSEVPMAKIDFNTVDLTSLIERLDTITDPRQRRGIRHSFPATLVMIACGTLAGHKSVAALSEWCESCSQQVLARLGARVEPASGLHVPPSYATIRRTLLSVDADELDRIVNTWAAEQTQPEPPPPAQDVRDDPEPSDRDGEDDEPPGAGAGAGLIGVAVDGKTLRGARRDDGTQVQLLAALRQDTGMVLGQCNVENDKTNEILAFEPLLDPVDLNGIVITADALHTQRAAATFLAGKGAHYIFGVKGNQPRLHAAALEAAQAVDLDSPEHERTRRGHGRIDTHRVWTAPIWDTTLFPNAKRFIIVERESATLTDELKSIETRCYVTDLDTTQANTEHLFRLVNGHWAIENSLHWVRDVTYGEDHSQTRTGTLPRALATLRNLAIGIIRHTTSRTVNIAAATRQLAREPDRILDLLGIPARL